MTAQTPDKIIIDGNTLPLYCEPNIDANSPAIEDLEQRLESDDAILLTLAADEPAEVDEELYARVYRLQSSACWRGYIATWTIIDQHLYLTALDGKFRLLTQRPLPANWFSGELIIPYALPIGYFHAGYGIAFLYYQYIQVVNGKVLGREVRRANPYAVQ